MNDYMIERMCEVAHDAYEAAAAEAGWETQAASRVSWSDVPEPNKVAMRAAMRAVVAMQVSDLLTRSEPGVADRPSCGCRLCYESWRETNGLPWASPRNLGWMIVCSECGNKRCPRATNHRNECTGSNEPGQPGSRYAERPDFNIFERPSKEYRERFPK